MREAICHYSFHRRWEKEKWTLDRLAGEVKALGVEGIDFHVSLLGSPSGAPALIKEAVVKHGLVLSGLSLGNNFCPDDSGEFQSQVENVKEWIRVAAEVNAPVSRIFGGTLPSGKRGDPDARAECRGRIIKGLTAVMPEAEKREVVLALENHGSFPCTGEEQVGIIEKINSPFLKATIDIGNYMDNEWSGQESHRGTRVAAKYAAYVHFKDFKKVPDTESPWGWKCAACVIGEGDVDLRACLEALRDAGYDGFVALEYEGPEDEESATPRSVEFMKRVMEGF